MCLSVGMEKRMRPLEDMEKPMWPMGMEKRMCLSVDMERLMCHLAGMEKPTQVNIGATHLKGNMVILNQGEHRLLPSRSQGNMVILNQEQHRLLLSRSQGNIAAILNQQEHRLPVVVLSIIQVR